MTNTGMFFRMLLSAVFRRRSRAVMAVVASLVGAATLSCLAMICIAVPQQMNQEMRAYGANLIVTPLADSENGKSGIDDAMVEHTTEMVSAKGSEKHATYRYENVRVNAAPYVMAGVNPAQVRNLNHHWVVDGSWPSAGKVLVGRDVADAMGLKVGGSITIGYRASDNAASSGQASQPGTDGTDGTAQSGTGGTSDGQTSSGSTGAQQTQNGHVSSDIMDTSGTEFRVAGIVDTGGSEDSIIYALAGDVDKLTGSTRGVDVCPDDAVIDDNLAASAAFARAFAAQTGAVVAITGAIDIVADGEHAYAIRNGSALMGRITGAGCMLSCLCTAYAVANPAALLDATVAAVAGMGLAGQIAQGRMSGYDGNGSFRTYVLDALYHLDGDALEAGAKVEQVA